MHLVQALCLAHDGGTNLEEVERAAELAVQAQRIWESSKHAEESCNFNTGSEGEYDSPMMMICGLTDARGGSNAVGTEKALAHVVQVMLETVEDVNHKSTMSGYTPLIRASRGGHLAVVELLLKHENIKVNQAMNDGTTPLSMASHTGQLAVVELLLKQKKIKVNQAMNDGATPLYIASENGQLAVVELLLKQENIDVNQAMNDGTTPLFMASQNGHLAVVELLLKQENIDVNQAMNDGVTPLHVASAAGNVEIVKILLSKGADATLTAFDSTPLQIAEVMDKSEVAEVLRAHEEMAVSPADHLK